MAHLRSLFAISLLLAVAGPQSALATSIFKWVDDTGQVIYSSTPPPRGVQAESIEPAPQPTADAVREAEERTERAQALARELETERLIHEAEEAEAAEAARLRALESEPPMPMIIETPVYVPQPVYYPPGRQRSSRRHHKDDKERRAIERDIRRPPML